MNADGRFEGGNDAPDFDRPFEHVDTLVGFKPERARRGGENGALVLYRELEVAASCLLVETDVANG